ncbi:MAG: ion transporter [Rhodothermales bacterium]
MKKDSHKPIKRAAWRDTIHEVIFEADTPTGKAFDVTLINLIVLSVLVVMLESVASINDRFGQQIRIAEWFFTIAFTIEYVLRMVSVDHPLKYARSFFGVVDLLAIIPTYLSLLIPGTQFLLVIRLLRILRVFRVLKLAKYIAEADVLTQALRASQRKITIFLFTVVTLAVILGSMMYFIESDENGFTSIPRSIYWAIVTLTTVGYGDISPQTPLGQALASVVMILGYGILAVPTGIMSVEIARADLDLTSTRSCHACSLAGHDRNAKHCKHCGEIL